MQHRKNSNPNSKEIKHVKYGIKSQTNEEGNNPKQEKNSKTDN
jgi:hypothetical protein